MSDVHEEFIERETVRITNALERIARAFEKMAAAFVALQERRAE